jgi:hypothetical protein
VLSSKYVHSKENFLFWKGRMRPLATTSKRCIQPSLLDYSTKASQRKYIRKCKGTTTSTSRQWAKIMPTRSYALKARKKTHQLGTRNIAYPNLYPLDEMGALIRYSTLREHLMHTLHQRQNRRATFRAKIHIVFTNMSSTPPRC